MSPGRYQSFETVASDYDQTRVIPDAHLAVIAQILSRESHLERGGLFLDAGVGTGRFAVPLARLHPGQIIGVDIAPAMIHRISAKDMGGAVSLAQADLQRQPFRDGVFSGALMVHILHLIEQWPLVLSEIRRMLDSKSGTLFLGIEMGGRSVLVDFYYERARALHLLPPSLGASGMAQILAYLRRPERDGGGGAQITQMDTSTLVWKRDVPTALTLEALSRRTYSQMWDIPDDAHREVLRETQAFALRTLRRPHAVESLKSRFVLHAVRWR